MTPQQAAAEGIDIQRGQERKINGDPEPLLDGDKTLVQQGCSVCGKLIVRTGRNRLSDCGHMRMSGGKWVPKDTRPVKPEPAKAGVLTMHQAERIGQLAERIWKTSRLCEEADRNRMQAERDFTEYLAELTQ